MASQSVSLLPPDRIFYRVGGHRESLREKMPVVEEIFNRILSPLYGSQEKAIRQIEASQDRTCLLLYEGPHPVGVLQFKREPSDEFAEFGVCKSIEIKSLFVDHSQKNSGKGIGSCLIQKLFEEVAKLPSPHDSVHVTVSEQKQESLTFFQKKGFKIVHGWEGRYTPGVTEYLLSCPTKIGASNTFDISSSETMKPGSLKDEPELIHVIHNAHLGDILSLVKLPDGTFLSGSKDNTINQWEGDTRNLRRCVSDVEPSLQTDANWITDITRLNETHWLSGSRSGNVSLWTTEGEFVRSIHLETPRPGSHKSLLENARRVNCLAASLEPDRFFAGFPTMFDEVDLVENRTIASTAVHANDWVFCIQPVSSTQILAVVGGKVEAWDKVDHVWQQSATVLAEGKSLRKEGGRRQRPLIQSFRPMEEKDHYALAFLDGSVGLLDIEQQTLVQIWREHQGRVWSALPLSSQIIASSSEDRTVRLWDIRQRASVHTITSHVGSVTALLNWDVNTLIGATSPEKTAGQPQTGAQLRYYDLRL